jgi:hypothetical protein
VHPVIRIVSCEIASQSACSTYCTAISHHIRNNNSVSTLNEEWDLISPAVGKVWPAMDEEYCGSKLSRFGYTEYIVFSKSTKRRLDGLPIFPYGIFGHSDWLCGEICDHPWERFYRRPFLECLTFQICYFLYTLSLLFTGRFFTVIEGFAQENKNYA